MTETHRFFHRRRPDGSSPTTRPGMARDLARAEAYADARRRNPDLFRWSDPAAAIAAGRARRAREQRLRIWILIANVIVLGGSFAIDKALENDRSRGIAPLASLTAGALTVFVLWHRGRGREGVEQVQLLRVLGITLIAVVAYGLVVYVKFLVDEDTVATPGRFLLVIGASLMAATAFTDFLIPSGDEDDA